MVIALSTPVCEKDEIALMGKRTNDILKRNEYAVSVAEKYNLPYVDLYSVLVDKPDYYTNDGVHLNEMDTRLL